MYAYAQFSILYYKVFFIKILFKACKSNIFPKPINIK